MQLGQSCTAGERGMGACVGMGVGGKSGPTVGQAGGWAGLGWAGLAGGSTM